MSSDHGSRLRDLIEKWRVKAHKSTSDPRANTYEQCADELDALLRASASAPPEKETAAAYSERVQRLRSGVYIRTGEQLSERVLAAILAYQASLTPVASASALSPEPAPSRLREPEAPQEEPSDFEALLEHHRATERENESLKAQIAALRASHEGKER